IILDTEDYLHIARPEIAPFRRLSYPGIRPDFRRMA
ncbi:hypothetical protein Q2398_25250, partial [Escherichia coli]|nr:hypothetical protein [Escherichia coli]